MACPLQRAVYFALQVLGYCVALHGFSGERDDDLRFDAGDRIAVTAHLDADWLRGKVHGRDGIFPAAFVTIDTDDVNAGRFYDLIKGRSSPV